MYWFRYISILYKERFMLRSLVIAQSYIHACEKEVNESWQGWNECHIFQGGTYINCSTIAVSWKFLWVSQIFIEIQIIFLPFYSYLAIAEKKSWKKIGVPDIFVEVLILKIGLDQYSNHYPTKFSQIND